MFKLLPNLYRVSDLMSMSENNVLSLSSFFVKLHFVGFCPFVLDGQLIQDQRTRQSTSGFVLTEICIFC